MKMLLYLFYLITIFLISIFLGCSKGTTIPQLNPSVSASCSYGDTLEITIRLEKSWYEIPDTVHLALEIKNISGDTINVEFFDGPGYNFAVYDTFQIKVWEWRYWQYPDYWIAALSPDSCLFFPVAWDMKNDSGEVVTPDVYEAVGWIGFYPMSDLRSPFLSFLLK